MATVNSNPSGELPAQAALVPARIELVDALRGFALMGICIIHCLEYFELYPANPDPGMVHSSVFFLFAAKAYAMFAMLFGLSFFIIRESHLRKGNHFTGRFAWRSLLLIAIGYLHTFVYHGDILMILGITRLVLLLVQNLSSRWLFFISLICIA